MSRFCTHIVKLELIGEMTLKENSRQCHNKPIKNKQETQGERCRKVFGTDTAKMELRSRKRENVRDREKEVESK